MTATACPCGCTERGQPTLADCPYPPSRTAHDCGCRACVHDRAATARVLARMARAPLGTVELGAECAVIRRGSEPGVIVRCPSAADLARAVRELFAPVRVRLVGRGFPVAEVRRLTEVVS